MQSCAADSKLWAAVTLVDRLIILLSLSPLVAIVVIQSCSHAVFKRHVEVLELILKMKWLEGCENRCIGNF